VTGGFAELAEIEREIAALDAAYRPVAKAPVEPGALDDVAAAARRVQADLDALGVEARARSILQTVVARYADGDEAVRAAIRRLFDRHTSFRWAAHLPADGADPAAAFRAQLICVSARDQGSDTRDELLGLTDLCRRARRAGVAVEPILAEVAAMSSDVDRYGMGSMRSILLRFAGAA
jgi:hypothetical protein